MFQTHKPIYFVLAILAAIGIAAGVLFAIQNFKIEEEVNSFGQEAEKQAEAYKSSALIYPGAKIATTTPQYLALETYDGRSKVESYYSAKLAKLGWTKIADLSQDDLTDCGGDWGGTYKKGEFGFKLHVCGFPDKGFLTDISFKYIGDTTYFDVFGQGASAPASTQDTSDWQTYRNEEFGFSVQYPPGWIEPSREEGDTSFAIGYRENSQLVYWITSGYISADQLNRMGVSYCSANSTDAPRCENKKIGGALIQIDWGLPESKPEQEGQSKAVAWVFDAKGGIVVFTLQPVTAQSRVRFNEILSTFKFTKSSSLLQVCPDEWYQNDMPIVSGTPESRQYYVLNGQRRELAEFDAKWVKTNCKINKQIVE